MKGNLRKPAVLLSILMIVFAACKKDDDSLSVVWIGNDTNWFNEANWSSGQVPGSTDDVLLNDGAQVSIDFLISPSPALVNNLTIRDGAQLRIQPNSILRYNQLILEDDGLLDAQSSTMQGDELLLIGNTSTSQQLGFGGMRLNPTTNDNRSIKITANTVPVSLFLGGRFPASAGSVGTGYYANLSADQVELNGQLSVDTIYGHIPSVGENYQIVTGRDNLTGTFNNFEEGDTVQVIGDVNLVITYEGGDGNDVVLIAQ